MNKEIERIMERKTSITAEELHDFYKEIQEFYKERGNPPTNAIWLSNLILRRLRNDMDYYINAEGIKGSGKSNLMLLLALLQARNAGIWKNKTTGEKVKILPRVNPLPEKYEFIKPSFNFDLNMSFLDQSQKIQEKFNMIDRYMPFIVDEGSKNLHKYNWQSKVQFKLVQMSDTERYQNKSFFVCFPNFKELNSVFRNDRISMRLYVYYRNKKKGYASAVISLRDVNRWIQDPWHMDDNAKNFEYLLRKVPAAQRNHKHILYAEKKLKGYAGGFDFPSLEKIAPRIWKIYMKYKTTNAKRELAPEEKSQESKNIQRWKYATKMLMAYIKQKYPELRWQDFRDLTNISHTTLNRLWREKLEIEDKEKLKEKAVGLLRPKT
jgi:hypothetical protein